MAIEIQFAPMEQWVLAVQPHNYNNRHRSAAPDTDTQFSLSYCEMRWDIDLLFPWEGFWLSSYIFETWDGSGNGQKQRREHLEASQGLTLPVEVLGDTGSCWAEFSNVTLHGTATNFTGSESPSLPAHLTTVPGTSIILEIESRVLQVKRDITYPSIQNLTRSIH